MSLFWFVFLPAVAYQFLAIAASLRHVARRSAFRPLAFHPAVSVLKPLRGMDPNTHDAFVSQITQEYPDFEILFGVQDENDPAVPEVRGLQSKYPNTAIHLIVGAEPAPNRKVGVLMHLSHFARGAVWVINDSDIKVTPDYLTQVVSPLIDESVGVVTCPYRAVPHTAAAAWEALGIATDFIPSALVAPLLGIHEFGFGSTLAFRAADLERAGGFAAIASYIADDYQLAKRIARLHKRALLSTYTVETSLGQATWSGIWRHQLRWARTIRASKPAGYLGLPIAHAGVWILVAIGSKSWLPAAALAFTRIFSAFLAAAFVVRTPLVALCWLAPVWDLYSFAVWAASYAGWKVYWRDRVMTLDAEGRIRAHSGVEESTG